MSTADTQMTASAIMADARFDRQSDTHYNLYLHKAGKHMVEQLTKSGNGFSERKTCEYGRVAVGRDDVKLLSSIEGLRFEFSKSGANMYLTNATEHQREIVELIIKAKGHKAYVWY